MSQQPYQDPYRVNPNPINTTSTLNQPGSMGITGTTYTPGTLYQPSTTLNQPGTLPPQQTGQTHGILHRKQRKQGERSSSSSSSSEQKKRRQQTGEVQPQKQGFMQKIKEKTHNIMHKSEK